MKYRLLLAFAVAMALIPTYFFLKSNTAPGVSSGKTTNPAMAIEAPVEPVTHTEKQQGFAGSSESVTRLSKTLPIPLSSDTHTHSGEPADAARLWRLTGNEPSIEIDGLPAKRLRVDPSRLQDLHVGQSLIFDIPDSGIALEARIDETRNGPAGVKVWQAEIVGAARNTGVIISQGKVQTHLAIASEKGNYSVVIDNRTGESTLVDEREIHAREASIDDGIVVRPPDEPPPPSLN